MTEYKYDRPGIIAALEDWGSQYLTDDVDTDPLAVVLAALRSRDEFMKSIGPNIERLQALRESL